MHSEQQPFSSNIFLVIVTTLLSVLCAVTVVYLGLRGGFFPIESISGTDQSSAQQSAEITEKLTSNEFRATSDEYRTTQDELQEVTNMIDTILTEEKQVPPELFEQERMLTRELLRIADDLEGN